MVSTRTTEEGGADGAIVDGGASLPTLELRCHKCRGGGWHNEGGGERVRCGLCGGAGYVATEFGRRVLVLMRHNFRPLYEDMRRG